MARHDIIYLVRHGVADASSPSGDLGRALTPKGREQFAAFAGALAPDLEVVRIVSSPARRARETAELFGGILAVKVEEDAALAPGESSGRDLLALARRLGPGTALVGHNPEIGDAIAVGARRAQAIVPGTIAELELREGDCRLCWVKSP